MASTIDSNDTTNSGDDAGDRDDTVPAAAPPRWSVVWAAFVGFLAAAAALATGELFSGLVSSVPSLPVAIFDVLVDYSPEGVVSWSRETFDTNQKMITVTGIVVVTLLLGAFFGVLSRGNRRIGVAAFVGFGVFGGWAAARSPLSSGSWSWVSALATIGVGVFVLTRLLALIPDLSRSATAGAHGNDDGTDLGAALVATPERRRFLGIAGTAAFFAVFGATVGRALRNSNNVEAARDRLATQLGDTSRPAALDAVPASATFDNVDGVSTLITPNDDFYLIDTAFSPPQVDPANWTLTLKGMVDNEITLSFDDLLAMDQIEEVITLSCVSNEVGGGLVGNAVWTGVPLATLLDMAGVQDGATQIVGRSVDDWTGGFPTEVAYDGRPAMVALTMNGEPLPVKHGFPARLVIPGLYGYVSATKWLKEIELTTWEGYDGYWIPRGWAKEGPIKTQSRIDVPANGATVAAGPTPIAGVAWAGHRSVDGVEVRVDDGEWIEATLSGELSENSWRQWMISWDATPGDHVVEVRATDGTDATQTDERVPPAPDGATGHHTVNVRVA